MLLMKVALASVPIVIPAPVSRAVVITYGGIDEIVLHSCGYISTTNIDARAYPNPLC